MRAKEQVLWGLFSSGGMIAALFLPALALMLWVAAPLGLVSLPGYGELVGLARHPLTRLFLFALIGLSYYHWAHRFRYTLYDGLQLYHLNELIAAVTYGLATALTVLTGYVLMFVA